MRVGDPPVGGRYSLVEPYGGDERFAGGKVQTWHARDTLVEREVVLRVITPGGNSAKLLIDRALEMSLIAHPGLGVVYEAVDHGDYAIVVCEWVDGTSLADTLATHGPLTPTAARETVGDVAEAITVAHHAGLPIGGITAERVVLRRNAAVTVSAVPALFADEPGDIRQLGELLYAALTGERPDLDDPDLAQHLNRSVPRDLAVLCQRALDPDPTRQLGSAAAFAAVLRPRDQPHVPPAPGAGRAGDRLGGLDPTEPPETHDTDPALLSAAANEADDSPATSPQAVTLPDVAPAAAVGGQARPATSTYEAAAGSAAATDAVTDPDIMGGSAAAPAGPGTGGPVEAGAPGGPSEKTARTTTEIPVSGGSTVGAAEVAAAGAAPGGTSGGTAATGGTPAPRGTAEAGGAPAGVTEAEAGGTAGVAQRAAGALGVTAAAAGVAHGTAGVPGVPEAGATPVDTGRGPDAWSPATDPGSGPLTPASEATQDVTAGMFGGTEDEYDPWQDDTGTWGSYDDDAADGPAEGSQTRRKVLLYVVPVAALLLVVLLGVFVGQQFSDVVGDDEGATGPNAGAGTTGAEPGEGETTETPGEPVALPPVSAAVFDPFGDGEPENDEDVGLAFDGDAGSAWQTLTYQNTPEFGNLKPGVGLIFDLGQEFAINAVELATNLPGSAVEVRVGAAPDAALDSYPVVGTLDPFADAGAVGLAEPVRARFVLVWFVRLVESNGGFQGALAECRILGS